MNFELFARIIEITCAAGALLISTIALAKSNKASKIQQKVAELDERLKSYELEKMEQEKESQGLARIEAKALELGKGRHRIRISNTGKARAHNIDFEVLDQDCKGFFQKEKTPYEFLDAYDSFDEVVIYYDNFPPKVNVITKWEDEDGKEFTRENILSF